MSTPKPARLSSTLLARKGGASPAEAAMSPDETLKEVRDSETPAEAGGQIGEDAEPIGEDHVAGDADPEQTAEQAAANPEPPGGERAEASRRIWNRSLPLVGIALVALIGALWFAVGWGTGGNHEQALPAEPPAALAAARPPAAAREETSAPEPIEDGADAAANGGALLPPASTPDLGPDRGPDLGEDAKTGEPAGTAAAEDLAETEAAAEDPAETEAAAGSAAGADEEPQEASAPEPAAPTPQPAAPAPAAAAPAPAAAEGERSVAAAPAVETPPAVKETPPQPPQLAALAPGGAPPAKAGADDAPARDVGDRKAAEIRAAASGRFTIQLSSLNSKGAAEREWARLQSSFPDLLGDKKLLVQRAALGDRGTFYRIRTGPFAKFDVAREFCARLKSRKQDCLVVRRAAPAR